MRYPPSTHEFRAQGDTTIIMASLAHHKTENNTFCDSFFPQFLPLEVLTSENTHAIPIMRG
jgi:hypothetical protein